VFALLKEAIDQSPPVVFLLSEVIVAASQLRVEKLVISPQSGH